MTESVSVLFSSRSQNILNMKTNTPAHGEQYRKRLWRARGSHRSTLRSESGVLGR